jgi:hypothetical protein
MGDEKSSISSFLKVIHPFPSVWRNKSYTREVDTPGLLTNVDGQTKCALVVNFDCASVAPSITICCPTSELKCNLWQTEITTTMITGQMTNAAGLDPSEDLATFAPIFFGALSSNKLAIKKSSESCSEIFIEMVYDLGSYESVGTIEVR